MNKKTKQLEKLKKLAKDAGSDFFNGVDEKWVKSETGILETLESTFEEYLDTEEEYKDMVRELCSDTFDEKWNILKKIAVQVLPQSYVMWGSNEAIIELLPFVSDMVYTEGALWIKIDSFKPEMLCAFANVCKGEYTYEGDGLYCARWEGSVWVEETRERIIGMLEKKGYEVL